MKPLQPILALTVLLLLAIPAAAETAAAAAPALDSTATATATATAGAAAESATSSQPAVDCAAQAPFAPTALGGWNYCDVCSQSPCQGRPVGDVCGVGPFGELQFCQDQLVACIKRTYPESIYCKCTGDIVP